MPAKEASFSAETPSCKGSFRSTCRAAPQNTFCRWLVINFNLAASARTNPIPNIALRLTRILTLTHWGARGRQRRSRGLRSVFWWRLILSKSWAAEKPASRTRQTYDLQVILLFPGRSGLRAGLLLEKGRGRFHSKTIPVDGIVAPSTHGTAAKELLPPLKLVPLWTKR